MRTCLVALDVPILALWGWWVPCDLQLAGREWGHLDVLWGHRWSCGKNRTIAWVASHKLAGIHQPISPGLTQDIILW